MNSTSASVVSSAVDHATLEEFLQLPQCTSCGKGVVRPVDVMNGNVVFSCSNRPGCFFTAFAELPPLTKKVIYLDTSTVSHMARAKARGDSSGPYVKLYDALRRASARNLIVCPSSTIVEAEADFSTLSDILIQMSRHLSDPGLNHELQVKEAQLARTLDRWLGGTPAELELTPPWRDAFQSDPDVWHGTFNVIVNMRTPAEFVDAAKRAKDDTLPLIAKAYKVYADDGLSFEQIVQVEKTAFAQAASAHGAALYRLRAAYMRGEAVDPMLVAFSSTLDKLALMIDHRLKCGVVESYKTALDFLSASHPSEIPFAYISSRLQAGLAMLFRGPHPRQPKPGDQHDIEHMATFLPYVDVFIADAGIAALANQNHMRLGDVFGTRIQSLGENDIPEFTDWLEGLAAGSSVADLSERIAESIWRGGFNQDLVANMMATMPEAFQGRGESGAE